MVRFCADIGPKDKAWTDEEIIEIEKEFLEEHMPREKRRQYLRDSMEDEEAFEIYPIVLNLNNVTICIGYDLSIIMSNENEEQIRIQLENVVSTLDRRFPEKNLEVCKLWLVEVFERINRPAEDKADKHEKSNFKRNLIIYIIASVAVGVTIAVTNYFLGYLPHP